MKSDLLDRLASVKLTLVSVGLAMALVLTGTLAQTKMGTFAAQKEFFNSWWLYARLGDVKVPVFPGGLSVGMAWMVNLLAAFATRFTFRKRDAGILISHFGLIVLLLGQFLTQTLARETNMPIELGQTLNYSQSFKDLELALVMTSDAQADQVTSIPYSFFSREGDIDLPGLPFSLTIRKFYPNAQLRMSGVPGLATQGIGVRIAAQALPVTRTDEEVNAPVAYVEVREHEKSLGIWLVSPDLGGPQSFTVQGKTYQIYLRPERRYYPFRITLKEFRHDIYPGTDIPKNFSSLVHLENPAKKESRDALIYMNHPLRYEGQTFYQSSFGKNDRLSVFQVVDNPASATPYLGCALVVLGLLLEFLSHLFEFIRKRS
jgi:cytochrome c biogenesis protein ResB